MIAALLECTECVLHIELYTKLKNFNLVLLRLSGIDTITYEKLCTLHIW